MKTRISMPLAVLVAAAASLFGCVADGGDDLDPIDNDEETETDEAEILGGQLDNTSLSVAYLSAGSGCSATLIRKNALLTAAHCVDPKQDGYAEFGTSNGGWIKYYFAKSNIRIHPKYGVNPDHDIALVVLNKSVVGVTPSPLRTAPPTVGQSIKIVGFGYTSNAGGNGVGNRYVGYNKISEMASIYFGYKGNANICSGDSGGPSFIDGKVAGVHSSGYGSGYCSTTGFDMRVDKYATWINKCLDSASTCGMP
jgi:V8-like Glu-specific endopeptidase